MDFQALVNSTKREDNYINATKWCQAFGKEFRRFAEMKETKTIVNEIAKRVDAGKNGIMETKRGKGSETWVHPLLAIELAKWLSPEFHVFALETLKRYLEGDITLADDILQRASTKDAKWLAQRAEGKVRRSEFTDTLKEHGCNDFGYAKNTNAIYGELFGAPAQELKSQLQVKNVRDGLDAIQLAALGLTELLAAKRIKEEDVYGNVPTSEVSQSVAAKVKSVL